MCLQLPPLSPQVVPGEQPPADAPDDRLDGPQLLPREGLGQLAGDRGQHKPLHHHDVDGACSASGAADGGGQDAHWSDCSSAQTVCPMTIISVNMFAH